MNWNLPFDDKTLSGMSGKTFVLAENNRNEGMFVPVKELDVVGGGDCGKGWGFELGRGSLRLMRDGAGSRSCLCEFYGLECRGRSVYAVGHRMDVEERHGFGRTVLYEKRLLRPEDCKVCVSSHVGYESKTLEPLLKSIRKTGFGMDKVVVIVDGDPRWNEWAGKRDDGVTVLHSNADAMGFAGLLAVGRCAESEYWLLVHDTCEFERDFVGRMSGVDVGLLPDIVFLCPPSQGNEMGLYSGAFVSECGVDISATRPGELLGAFMHRVRVMVVASGKVEVAGEKDVYGSGFPRKVVRMASVGVRKFVGKHARGGRP